MGVKSLVALNKALLGKWSWIYANEKEAFRNQVIRGKYGEERCGWCSWEVREGYGVGLGKAIRKLGHLVSSRISFVVGNGQRVSFWKDKWCGTTPLCKSFPSLFALATSKEAWVKHIWTILEIEEIKGSWSPYFSRPLMIGRWMRWKTSCCVWFGREWLWMRRIGWGGWNRRITTFR